MLSRRLLLTGTAIGVLSAFAPRSSVAAFAAFAITRSDAEWSQRLTPAQYAVLRQRSTELPFSSPLLKEHRAGIFEHRAGIFACAGCGKDLFSSETKFDSGTGWPSFWAPLSEGVVGTSRDTSLGEVRTEVHCADCGGHLDHVFNDGPPVTGLRYCMNGVAMSFRPATG